jgi:hypothetical protein
MLTLLRRGVLLLLACGLTVIAPVASAQDDQVFVDPDSPSGKEYELPVNSARQQGAADDKRDRAAPPQEAPLFGEGVERRATPAPARAPQPSRPRSSSTRKRSSEDVASATHTARAGADVTADRKAQAAAPEGDGGLAAIGGVGAGVLLLGGLAGLFLRRRAER